MIHPSPASAEIELKLALPGADPKRIGGQLAAIAQLSELPPTEQRLKNLYFDTPEQHLRRAGAALRLRSLRQGRGRARWLQTLKTGDAAGAGGLSQRGEWEASVRSGELDPIVLQGTPWPTLDPDGQLLPQLAPCFETEAVRTLRLYTADDGSRIEVVLDIGSVRAGELRAELCELELELLKGRPDALFELAEHITAELAVLPAPLSKAERGWRLLDGTSHAPRRARKPELAPETPVLTAAQAVLGEMLGQFTQNLCGIVDSDGAELVHQARVGWRRWRSALWLFKPLLANHPRPDLSGLRPLLNALGATRDLDVAALESLPQWCEAYIAGDAERAQQWQTMEAAVAAERRIRRSALLSTLQSPATGQALLQLERWLHALPQAAWTPELAGEAIEGWAAWRTKRLHARLQGEVKEMQETDLQSPEGIEHQHNVRLLAKRTRYVLEALRAVLPRERTRRWQDQATELQTSIGAARDLMLLATLLEPLGVTREILGFLRGVAAGRTAGD